MVFENDYIPNVARLLIYIAQADGEISADEIKYFDDYFRIRTGDESVFTRISGQTGMDVYRNMDKSEVIAGLSGFPSDLQIISILDAFGIALTDGLEEIEEERLIDLCRSISLSDEACTLIEIITGIHLGCECNYASNEIISIGNDPLQDDICINSAEIRGRIFFLDGGLYFFGLNSEGNILLNDSRTIFNGIVTEIKNGDFLNLGRFNLFYSELVRRITRKAARHEFRFSIVFDSSESKLVIDDEEKIVDPDIKLSVTGNICFINIISQRVCVTSDNNTLMDGIDHYIGLDQYIVVRPQGDEVDEAFPGFSLDVPSLLSARLSKERIFIDGSGASMETKHISNNTRNADIVLESIYTFEPDKFVDIFVDIVRMGAIRIKNRGYSVFLNGEKVEEDFISVSNGDVLQVEKEIVTFDFEKGVISNTISRIEQADVSGLTFKYKKDNTGIDDITFSSRLGEMVCIMGPSGSGKSSLIKVMLGYQKASAGSVKLNGLDFYENFENLKNYVGYVPQDDLLYENLTVFDNLYYSGKLKLPHVSEKELVEKIDELLLVLGLSEKKHKIVGSEMKRTLSGGERRRLNIGLELLNDADVIFLDEPTSGLSSYDSKKIIELLKGYASHGKIIYVVIHQPASEIFYMFDTLILLDYGGKLVYYGDTENAVSYFSDKNKRINISYSMQKPSPDLILEILQEVKRDLKGDVICEIDKEGNKVPSRVCAPHSWRTIFDGYREKNKGVDEWRPDESDIENLRYKKETVKHRLIKFRSLFMRNFKDRIKDKTSVIMALVAPAVLVVVLAFLMRTGSAPAYININDYNDYAKIILTHDTKVDYDEKSLLLLNLYKLNSSGIFRLDDSALSDDLKKFELIFKAEKTTGVLSRFNIDQDPVIPESLDPLVFREILRSVHEPESEFFSFLEYYNYYDVQNRFIRNEPENSAESENDNDDIHKIFRDAGVDSYLFKTNPNFSKFLFLSVIILIFLGLTSSMNEIQKDRAKIRREKLLNIRVFDYLLSKTLTTFLFAVIQTAIYTTGAVMIIEIPFAVPELGYYGFSFIASFYLVSLVLMMTSSMFGYYVSSKVQSEKTIFILIPVIMIPQIIFGGLFLAYDDMGGRFIQKDRPVPMYCDLIFSRWGYEALVSVSYNYNPHNVWKEIVNNYNSDNQGRNWEYIEKIENAYYYNKKVSFNDELYSEMINGKKKWNYLGKRAGSFSSDNSWVANIRRLFESHDPFPGNYKKTVVMQMPSFVYNSIVLIMFAALFYFLTLSAIKKERGL